MQVTLPKSRWHAFLTHFAVSGIIFLTIFAVITLIWYPGVFIEAGGWRGIKLVAAVDLILGPTLTLLVYDRTKKSIKFDLSVIAALQLSCLVAGLIVIERERPLLQVLTDDSVHLLVKSDLESLKINITDVNKFSGSYPKAVYVKLPPNKEQLVAIIVDSLFSKGVPIQGRLDLFETLPGASSEHINWRLELRPHDSEKNCIWLPLKSPHFSGQGCLHLTQGIITLRL